jgi:hypothetical protein
MQIEGLLGTRADIIIDIVMITSALLPFLLIYAIYLAKKEQYDLHKWIQITLFIVVNLLVIALEVDIRYGGIDKIIEQSKYFNSSTLGIVFIIHLVFAISSTLLWFWLIIISAKRYPIHFRFPHKKYGMIVYIDIVLTVITGWILYALVFAN